MLTPGLENDQLLNILFFATFGKHFPNQVERAACSFTAIIKPQTKHKIRQDDVELDFRT